MQDLYITDMQKLNGDEIEMAVEELFLYSLIMVSEWLDLLFGIGLETSLADNALIIRIQDKVKCVK